MSENWAKIREDLEKRHEILLKAETTLSGEPKCSCVFSPGPGALQLAATDLFVDKAQGKLTSRGWSFAVCGAVCALMAVGVMGLAAWHIYALKLKDILGDTAVEKLNGYFVTIVLAKALSAGGFVVGAAVFLMHLSRALLHEATVLFSRRHALRFGRLYVYLTSGPVKLKELQEAFRWSDEFSSEFKTMTPEIIIPKGNPLSIMSDSAKSMVESAAKIAKRLQRRPKKHPTAPVAAG